MGRRTALVALAASIVLAAGSLVWTLRRRDAVAPPLLSKAPSAQLGTAHTRESSDARLEPAVRTNSAANKDAFPSDQVRRPEGTWIHGRVRLPEGMPADDRIEVIARYWDLEDSPPPSARVENDGTFQLPFPSGVNWGALELRSRFLYLERDFEIDLSASANDVVLEPKLGGCVVGRVVPPRGISRTDPDFASARMELAMTEADGSRTSEIRSSALTADLRFEIPQVPPGRDRILGIASKAFLPSERTLDVSPGTAVELEVPLEVGVRVSGRVLDAEGRALAGARIGNDAELGSHGLVVGSLPAWNSESDAAGGFQLKSIHPGRVAILVEATGYLSKKIDLGGLEEGDTRDGLEIRLDSGLIHGRVAWPDGHPAAGCSVDLRLNGSGRAHAWLGISSHFRSSTSEDGNFSIGVTDVGAYHLTARAIGRDEPSSESGGRRGPCGVAGVDGVQPGGESIEVVLAPGHAVHGRVVDDIGHALESFSVRASMVLGAGESEPLDDVVSSFQDPNGEFTISCLSAGHWVFTPTAEGRLGRTSEPRSLPGDASQLVLAVPRGSMLSGVVLDPSGSPVPFAQVLTSLTLSDVTTNAEGQFHLTTITSGHLDLWAVSGDWAPSPRIQVASKPGQQIDGLALMLRVGGRITGEVIDGNGRPDAGRKIKASVAFGDSIFDATSDANGSFEIHGLPEGRYSIFREANAEETSSMNESGRSPWRRFCASKSHAIVDVVEGAVTHVVLGGPKDGGIRVHGRVSAAGVAAAAVRVKAVGFTSSGEDLLEAETDSQGRFELKLDEPDLYDFTITQPDQLMELSYWKWVGEERDGSLDLALPEGTVRGVARSAADQPLAGIWIALGPPDSPSNTEGWSGAGSTVTDESGSFSFVHVPGGTYDLVYGSDESNEPKTMRLTLREGARIEDVVIRVP